MTVINYYGFHMKVRAVLNGENDSRRVSSVRFEFKRPESRTGAPIATTLPRVAAVRPISEPGALNYGCIQAPGHPRLLAQFGRQSFQAQPRQP